MPKTAALGTSLKKGGTTPTAIASLTSIGGLDLSSDTIDVTALDSANNYREFIGSWKDGGEVSISGFFDPDDDGQAALLTDFEAQTSNAYIISFPSAMSTQWEFNAIVTALSTSSELEDAVTFEATLKVSGKPTLNLAPS